MLDQSYYEKADAIIEQYGRKPASLIPIMQDIQAEYRYLPGELLNYVADEIGVTRSRAYSVATFYENFSFDAKGKYIIKVCDGTACHVRKSQPVKDAIVKELGLEGKKCTTEDMMFTVETVSCLGACGLAPTMMVNEDVHPKMTPDKAVKLIRELRGGESGMSIASKEDLLNKQKEAQEKIDSYTCRILVCSGTGCVASGSQKIYDEMVKLCEGLDNVEVSMQKDVPHIGTVKTGCQGLCELGPLVRIEPQHLQYVHVQVDDCKEIVEKTVLKGEPIERLFYKHEEKPCEHPEDIPFLNQQTRIVLEHCGNIDAESIDEYIAAGGFQAVVKAFFEMTPEEVIDEITKSGIRGRGGAGFPMGKKWSQVARIESDVKYVVCNGDEGDPGAFMDGSVMEGDPYKLMEGMIIAAYAVGAHDGYIYVRAEYPLSVARLKLAIAQAEEYGLLGDNILGSGVNFHLHINRGAGAFVCGEGSALTASIEGKRGMPRVKPPRTVEKGLWEKPTVLNNVETYANVARIILDGSDWYRSIGTEGSSGTKTFSLTGAIENTGLIEVPMGTTLRQIIYDIGGGIKKGAAFKAVQIGGPSGGCLVEKHLDEPLDFDSVKKFNAIIGSGGLVVMDENTCMVDVAKFFMGFTQRESCGKCGPCRIGTKRMLELLEKITGGKGEMKDLDKLEETAKFIQSRSLCGLGKSAPLPVISTLQNFRDEYEEHIVEGKCRAHVCEVMKVYTIDPEKCKGCTKCARNCPVSAITGEKKEPHIIDQIKCIKCGTCMENCVFDAISVS